MLRYKILLLLLTTQAGLLFAQSTNELYQAKINWADKPVLHVYPPEYKGASAVYLNDKRIYHYAVDGQGIVADITVYKLIKVEDAKGIESFNKIYIPVYKNEKISDIKARAITSTGKVINITEDKIKEQEEDGSLYKMFAMEGLDKGSEIEYTYTVKKFGSYFGSEIFHGKTFPYKRADFVMITPDHLKYEVKGFNGFTVLNDSVINEERYTPAYSENITPLDDEKYAIRESFLRRVDFKLSYNLSTNKNVEMYTWKEFSKRAFNNLTYTTDKEKKAVAKFIAKCDIPENATAEKTIQLLEDNLKTKINIDDKLVSDDDNLETVIKTGNTTDFGACRLMIAMLENRGIKYQAVFPSVRDRLPVEESFANWNRVDDILIYFPSTGKFMQPSGVIFRYPIVAAYWAGTKGLFLKETSIGDMRTAIGKFDTIPLEPFEKNYHNLEIKAKIDQAYNDTVIIETKNILGGYMAANYRPIWTFLPKDKIDESVKEIITSSGKSENVSNIKTENTALTDAWYDNKPLVISGTIRTAETLEKAGNKMLFKIGELIGAQAQMYQEKPRQLPAELEYPHGFKRHIEFTIPAGYSIKNVKDLNMDITFKEDDKVSMMFKSTYALNGDVLTVDVEEDYVKLRYPLAEFESFKKVINASADFNKIVLVLEKK